MVRTMNWQAIVPVRGGAASKSRLSGEDLPAPMRTLLARAFASDVVAAALTTPGVAGVTVVTRDPDTAHHFAGLGAVIFAEAEGAGLDGAIRSASEHLRVHHPQHGIVSLMGDLAGATSEALAAVLAQAAGLDLGVLADHDGAGTTILTATGQALPRPAYGSGSFARHVAAGHVPLEAPVDSPLRRDIDTREDLDSVARLGLGAHTREFLSRFEMLA